MIRPGPKLASAVAWLIAEQLNSAAEIGLPPTPREDGSIAVGDLLVRRDEAGRWFVTVTKPEAVDGKTS